MRNGWEAVLRPRERLALQLVAVPPGLASFLILHPSKCTQKRNPTDFFDNTERHNNLEWYGNTNAKDSLELWSGINGQHDKIFTRTAVSAIGLPEHVDRKQDPDEGDESLDRRAQRYTFHECLSSHGERETHKVFVRETGCERHARASIRDEILKPQMKLIQCDQYRLT